MVDTGFDDFLDSDDDEFFREASNQCLDYDEPPSFSQLSGKNATSTQANPCKILTNKSSITNATTETNYNIPVYTKTLSECMKTDSNCEISPVVAVELGDYFSDCDDVSIKENNISSKLTTSDISLKTRSNVAFNASSIHLKDNVCLKIFDKNNVVNHNTPKNLEIASKVSNELTCMSNVTEFSSSTHNSTSNECKQADTTASLYINNRFTPGFTPKAKKRKLPGPAGLIEMFDGSKEKGASSSQNTLGMDIGFENIISSQFTPEHLSLSSWQKLQTAVSSCPNLHSTVKYYSIQRVLQESSKKKLPKHMVVPVLCVLLKKFSCKGPSTISVFMDDTGEINGKLDAEVKAEYKNYLVEGSALILRNVTFLCNVLILKVQSIVSIYHPDGTEKHTQNLESVLETYEPLKPMNCNCLKLPHHTWKNDDYKNYHKSSCHSQNSFSNLNPNETIQNMSHKITPGRNKFGCYNLNQPELKRASNENGIECKGTIVSNCRNNPVCDETVNQSKTMRSDKFLENLLDGDNCMDDFDELLGNLDEKSFITEI